MGHDRGVVQSVELLLSDNLDAAVRAQWQALAAADLPSQARHTGASNRPHVTLAVTQTTWDHDTETRLAEVAATFALPLPVLLGGVIVFGPAHRHVLALLMVPSAGLLALQAAIITSIGDVPQIPAHTAPGQWTPHVTLARGLKSDQLPTALRALSGTATGDQDGEAVTVRRWDGQTRREWSITP
jgi:2'-5' RNA ligase